MVITILAYIILIVILYCLASSAYYMVSRKHDSTKMAKALSWRIGLSLGLFVFLLIAILMGWLHPHPKVIM